MAQYPEWAYTAEAQYTFYEGQLYKIKEGELICISTGKNHGSIPDKDIPTKLIEETL